MIILKRKHTDAFDIHIDVGSWAKKTLPVNKGETIRLFGREKTGKSIVIYFIGEQYYTSDAWFKKEAYDRCISHGSIEYDFVVKETEDIAIIFDNTMELYSYPHLDKQVSVTITVMSLPKERTIPDVPVHVKSSSRYRSEGLKHRTSRGDLVRSKGEVIVADTLTRLGLEYDYEKELFSPQVPSDRILPDFTIYYNGEIFYWEHLGMTSNVRYLQRWDEKKQWYIRHGLGKQLIESKDSKDGSIDSREILLQARARILG